MRTAIERHDPGAVDHLVLNREVGPAQDQADVVVVGARPEGRNVHDDAAIPGREVFRPGRQALRPSGSRAWRRRRKLTIWRVDDERGTIDGIAPAVPLVVVTADAAAARQHESVRAIAA